jgi:Zn-dependent protease
MPDTLALIDVSRPALWAVIIGWVMSVTLHEFGHNVVGYWGGDHTIRDEGRLTLNPLQYVDPFMTIVLPVIFLMLGGIPLPGGATHVDHTRLRSRFWDSAVSAAGPLINFILFGICALALLPAVGFVDVRRDPNPIDWSPAQKFVAAMCFLQLLAVFLNLVPIPGLDGYGIIEPYLPRDFSARLSAPHVRSMFLFGYFIVLWQAPGFMGMMAQAMRSIMGPYLYAVSHAGFQAAFSG